MLHNDPVVCPMSLEGSLSLQDCIKPSYLILESSIPNQWSNQIHLLYLAYRYLWLECKNYLRLEKILIKEKICRRRQIKRILRKSMHVNSQGTEPESSRRTSTGINKIIIEVHQSNINTSAESRKRLYARVRNLRHTFRSLGIRLDKHKLHWLLNGKPENEPLCGLQYIGSRRKEKPKP